MKNKYDTSVVFLYAIGKESLLPDEFRKKIPYSTISNWRNTDGGKENHNKYIETFISKLSKHKITKIRALKVIRFSNSPAEAVHRTIKGRYLKNRKFESIKSFNNYMKWLLKIIIK